MTRKKFLAKFTGFLVLVCLLFAWRTSAAAGWSPPPTLPSPYYERVRAWKIAQAGTDISITYAIGSNLNPLMWAAMFNHNPETITALVELGVDINAVNRRLETALMLAARSSSNPKVITALVKNGADINAGHRYGITPLMWAAWLNSNPAIVSALLEHGADANIKDNYGQMAVDFAIHNPHLANAAVFQKLYGLSQSPQ